VASLIAAGHDGRLGTLMSGAEAIHSIKLTVVTAATGVEPGQAHAQHIHGFPAGSDGTVRDAKPPTLAQDDDLDGLVELAEGLDTYGPILLNLDSPPDSGAFPKPEGDSFLFVETYDLRALSFDANPDDGVPGTPLDQVLTAENLVHREIVLHGLTLREGQGTNGGEADGTAGYKAVLPIATGEIQELPSSTDGFGLSAALAFGHNGDLFG
jgi:hypothetical protein